MLHLVIFILDGKKGTNTRDKNINRAEQSAAQTIRMLIILYIVSTVLNLIINTFRSVDYVKYNFLGENWMWHGNEVVALLDNVLNPVVYVLRYDAFQRCFLIVFCGQKQKTDRGSSVNTSVTNVA